MSLALGGIPIDTSDPERFGVAFTATNPCGAVISADRNVEEPLQTIASWGGCIGGRWDTVVDEGGVRQVHVAEPGDLALVSGAVIALVSTRNPSDRKPRMGSCTTDTRSAAPEVKLKIQACGMPEAVIIDSDSELVVPAGPATIEILTPAGWVLGRGPDEAETPWHDVDLKVSACPCSCGYHGRGVLTEWMELDQAAAEPLILVRPRRARTVSASSVVLATGATQNTTLQWRLDSNAAANRWIGLHLLQAGFPFEAPVSAAPFVAVFPPAGTSVTTLRWGIV